MTYTRSSQRAETVAVIGAGFIGCSFAAVFARAGLDVRIYDAHLSTREVAFERVARFLEQTGSTECLQSLSICDELGAAVSGVDWVQECCPEDLAVKRAVFEEVDRLCPSGTVLASSASALTMTQIAQGLRGASRCVVVHPTNPPHLLRFTEIVAGRGTSSTTVARAKEFVERVGQYAAILAEEIPGFILNRLQVALEREAFTLLSGGIASLRDIDAAVEHGLGPRWAALGPFAVEETNSDSIGEGLVRFREYFNDLMTELDREPMREIDDEFANLASDGVAAAYGPRAREQLLAKRDRTLLALREIATEPA